VDDERIERARRNFRYSHTELDPPSTLREHLDELEDAGGRVAVSGRPPREPVDGHVPTDATSPRGRGRAFAAMAAVVVTALVGGALILGLALRLNTQLTESPSPIPSIDTNGSPTAPPPPGASAFTWTLISSDGDIATYDVGDAVPHDGAGWIGVAIGGQGARTVHSDDGVRWVLDPGDPGLVAARPDHLNLALGIAHGPAGLVVVGTSANGDSSGGDVRAWRSTDGQHWQAALRISGDPNAEMNAVIGGAPGYVAVGSDGFPGASTLQSGSRGAAVWTSADGSSWTRVANQAGFGGAMMTGIAPTETGYVAWGENLPMAGAPALQPPIWTSTDGRSWTRANGPTFARDVFFPLGGVIVEPDRWVAVGTRNASDAEGGGFRPAAWVSTDTGRTWTAAPVEGSASGVAPSGYVHDFAAVGTDLIAIGHVEPIEPTSDQTTAAVWLSSDQGVTWTRLPDDASFRGVLMRRILPLDDNRFVVFGEANDPNALVNPNLIWLATRQP
jgi:hypothetical protein